MRIYTSALLSQFIRLSRCRDWSLPIGPSEAAAFISRTWCSFAAHLPGKQMNYIYDPVFASESRPAAASQYLHCERQPRRPRQVWHRWRVCNFLLESFWFKKNKKKGLRRVLAYVVKVNVNASLLFFNIYIYTVPSVEVLSSPPLLHRRNPNGNLGPVVAVFHSASQITRR